MQDRALNCLVLQPIAASAIDLLKANGLKVIVAASTDFAVIEPMLQQADAIITRNHGLSSQEIAAAPNLKVVGVHGTGTDKVDKAALAERHIALANTPGANAQSVSELAVALMFACARSLVAADHASRRAKHSFRQTQATFELSGKKLGLIGFGTIAQLTAKKAQGLGMQVGVLSRFTPESELLSLGITAFHDVDALCDWADFVSLHGVPEGKPVIDEKRLQLIGPSGYLINTARGALVDEAALAKALSHGVIAGAALDVLTVEPIADDHPLLSCPNLILTPHIGGSTREALENTGRQVAEKVIAFFKI